MDEDVTPKQNDTLEVPGSLTPKAPRRSPRFTPGGFGTPLPEPRSEEIAEEEGENWSAEDDQMLVELVLDKLQLSRRQWDECARQLGADQRSLGARWQFLVDEGQVGLKLRRGGRRRRRDVRELWS